MTALVLGLLSAVALLGPLTGVPAMLLGRRAQREIHLSAGTLGGGSLAAGGWVAGLVGTLMWVLAFVAYYGYLYLAVVL